MKTLTTRTLLLVLSLAGIAAPTIWAAPLQVAVKVRAGSGAPLKDLQVSEDGATAFVIANNATSSVNGIYDKVEIYDLNERRLSQKLVVGEGASMLAVAANATAKQGQLAVRTTYYGAASLEDTISIWTYPKDKRETSFSATRLLDNALGFARDGSKLAINEEGTLSLFGDEGQLLGRPGDEVKNLTMLSATAHTFSPDGTRIIIGWRYGALVVYDATTFAKPKFAGDVPRLRKVARLNGHKSDITQLVWSKAGDLLLSSDRSGEMRLWSWPSRRLKAQWKANAGPLIAAFAPDGATLAIATSPPKNGVAVQLWNVATGLPTRNWKHPNAALQLAWRGTQTLVVGDSKGALLLVPRTAFAAIPAA